MAKCEVCGKSVSFGIKVSHSHRRSNRTWKPNIRKVRAIVNGTHKSVNACTRCLRSGKVERGYGSGNPAGETALVDIVIDSDVAVSSELVTEIIAPAPEVVAEVVEDETTTDEN